MLDATLAVPKPCLQSICCDSTTYSKRSTSQKHAKNNYSLHVMENGIHDTLQLERGISATTRNDIIATEILDILDSGTRDKDETITFIMTADATT